MGYCSQCDECQGTGQTTSTQICPECRGADEVVYPGTGGETCRKCKGKKFVPALITCPTCKGKGMVSSSTIEFFTDGALA